MTTITTARLTAPRLLAAVHEQDDLTYLSLQSWLDSRQSLLLPTSTDPRGLSLVTEVGRLHSVPWSLVHGIGPVAAGTTVTFSTGTLRFRRETEALAVPVGCCWLAHVEGTFTLATLYVPHHRPALLRLAQRW